MLPNEVMARLGSGSFPEKLTEALTEIAQEVVKTGKPGKVTVSFEIKQFPQGEPSVAIIETIGRRPPSEPGRGMVAYAMDGELHRTDPRQIAMTFRVVDEVTGEIRELPNDEESTLRDVE